MISLLRKSSAKRRAESALRSDADNDGGSFGHLILLFFPVGRWFTDPAKPEYPEIDLEMAVAVNSLSFAMPISREGELLVMRKAAV
jgi:hypothetical protein